MSEAASPTNTSNPFRIDSWFPDLSKETVERLRVYHDDLFKFNKTLNLVSPKTLAYADAIHFADSILAVRAIMVAHSEIKEMYDLGSGNGFPGVVLAILYPTVKVVCVDSDQRKCEFIKHLTSQLLLKNVEVKNCAIESLPQDSVRYGISRGLASISKAILMTRKAFIRGGILFHMKSDNWATEVGEIPTQLCSEWSPGLVKEYRLPVGEFKFAVVKTDKIS